MTFDDLWYRTTEANQQAEQAYHRLRQRYESFLEFERRRGVSRGRFRTLLKRISRTGAPYGAHTIVHRADGSLLLVRHDGVDRWVLPGGEVRSEEEFLEAARRELGEEAGVEASYEGLGMLTRVSIACDGHETWGVLPVFVARPETTDLCVDDPDGEISAARWFDFDELPADTRDRGDLLAWHEHAL